MFKAYVTLGLGCVALIGGAGAFAWRAFGHEVPLWAVILLLALGTGSLLASWWLAMRKTDGITEPGGEGGDDDD
jgi:hypothetical protein